MQPAKHSPTSAHNPLNKKKDLSSMHNLLEKSLDRRSSGDSLDSLGGVPSAAPSPAKPPTVLRSVDSMVAKKPSAAPMRTFELRRVSFVQLKAIDVVDQTFSAHVMLECCLRGGALDDDLMKTSDGWPAAPTADGSFRPSALWYLNNQFDWPTAQQFSVLESKVFRVGNDLHLVQRVDGVFSRPMNLRYFPFDTQELTATLCVTCAAEGPVPARLAVAPQQHSARAAAPRLHRGKPIEALHLQ